MNSIISNWCEIGNNQSICQVAATWESHYIYLKNWTSNLKNDDADTVLILLHDIGHYGESFSSFISWYTEKNKKTDIFTIDCIGHGLSTGTRGHVDDFETYINDLLKAFNQINFKDKKVFILGHGMGGLLAIDLYNRFSHQLSFKINGLVLTSFMLNFETIVLKFNLSKFLTKSAFKRLKISNFFEPSILTSSSEKSIGFAQDPLIVHRPSVGLISELKDKTQSIYQDAYYLDIPVFVAWSENDYYLNKIGMNYFVKGVKKELLFEKKYSLMKHDLYNEMDSQAFFEDLFKWITNYENINS